MLVERYGVGFARRKTPMSDSNHYVQPLDYWLSNLAKTKNVV